jgi:beta-catenin-like protein 1
MICYRLLFLCVLSEHIVSILASLVKNCSGIQRQRLMQKFVENDHEKVDRLVELHFKYFERVNKADDKIEQKKRVSVIYGLDYLRRM